MLRSPLINHLLRHYGLARTLLARQPLLARFGTAAERPGRSAGVRFVAPYQLDPPASFHSPLPAPPEELGAAEAAGDQLEEFEPIAAAELPLEAGRLSAVPAVPHAQPGVPAAQPASPGSPAAARRANQAPPAAAELRDTLLALREQARHPAAPLKPPVPEQISPPLEVPTRPRVPLGRRVVHLPGISLGPAASGALSLTLQPQPAPDAPAESGNEHADDEALLEAPQGALPRPLAEGGERAERAGMPAEQLASLEAALPPPPELPAEAADQPASAPARLVDLSVTADQSELFHAAMPEIPEPVPAGQPPGAAPVRLPGTHPAMPSPAASALATVAEAAPGARAEPAGRAAVHTSAESVRSAPERAQAGALAQPGPAGEQPEALPPGEPPAAAAEVAAPQHAPARSTLREAMTPGPDALPVVEARERVAQVGALYAEPNQRAGQAEAAAAAVSPREDAGEALAGGEGAGEPPREGMRRRLRPLLGIDPGDVRIHSDAAAQQLAQAYHADAVAIGMDIALAAGRAGDTPAAQALLAHELTHVARSRRPRFVPPIVRATPAPGGEEQLAERVEAQVAEIVAQPTPAPGAFAERAPNLAREPAPGLAAPAPLRERARWDGLPAPWEPLPAANQPSAAGAPPALASAGDTPVPGTTSATPVEPIVARAAEDRRTAQTKRQEQAPAAPKLVEPDLDAMAQQVYALLKQRMAAERRRHGW